MVLLGARKVYEIISECTESRNYNSDQGSQFTSPVFTAVSLAEQNNIKISMDGKGQALDNIFIERFWRSLKYEHIYFNPANGGIQLYQGIKNYIEFYNNERRHFCLNNQAQMCFSTITKMYPIPPYF
jgi:putative transposase